MTALSELEAIRDGLTSPFWQVFSRHIAHEWGPAGLAYQTAVKDAAKDINAVVELQKVLHTSDAMLALLSWPQNRIGQLKGQAQRELVEQRHSRGGV